MGLQQKPGISITENLIASNDGNVQYIPTVAFLSAERGRGNTNTSVIDQVDFINKFGYPTSYNYKAWYNIYEYLRYTNNINVMRVISTSWENYGIEFGSSTLITPVEKTNFYNEDIAFNTLNNNYTFSHSTDRFASIMNRETTQTQDIATAFCMSEDDYDLAITTEDDVNVLEKTVTTLPTVLTSDMEVNQLFVVNTAGTYTVEKLETLTDEDISIVGTVLDGAAYKTQIKISNNADLWSDPTTFKYTEVYFRNTKRSDLNDVVYAIDTVYDEVGFSGTTAGVAADADIYIMLTQNISLQDTTGELVFYDDSEDFTTYTATVSEGYLKEEEKYITISAGALSYSATDDEYEYIETGELDSNDDIMAIRIAYDTKIQNGTSVKTFRQIFNKDIDFNINFYFLVFKKYSGKFSLVEAYEVAKERDTATNAMYKRNYCEDTINQNSQYIYFIKNTTTTTETVVTNTVSITDLVLQADDDTTDFTDLNDYTTFETATDFYRNADNISFKYLLGIELDEGGVVNMNLAPFIANDRKDCIAILSPWNEADYLDGYDNMTGVVLNEFGIKNNPVYIAENNTYTIVYDNMKMIYSEFLEEYKWIPTIGDIAGVYTIEDDKNPYSAAAGFRTTPIKNVLKMLYTDVSDDNRDLLCYHSINHILKNYEDNEYYLYDILMYFDKDVLTKRLNIRRTLNHFKYNLRNLLKPYIYEFNSYPLRSEITSNINLMISGAIDAGGLYGGYAICDSTNNDANTIGQNELHVQILLQPSQVIRQIYIEINIEKQTLNISEAEV